MSLEQTPLPAKLLTTTLDWERLDLPASTRSEVQALADWLGRARSSTPGPGSKSGGLALFAGASGTGKTLAAAVLGKATSREVYRVDLSSAMSKYIGETEKNLAALFEAAEDRGWILFFDEADALLGKRSEVQDAHDRYANQEVSYLLQRLERFEGLAILATNLRSNLDAEVRRRFRFVIEFPRPDGVGTRA